MIEVVSAKKKALLAYKEKLLSDINFCEKRLGQVRLNASRAYVFEDEEDSSDSDTGLPQPLRSVSTTSQLNQKRSNLSVCLQATQELTSLQVLESEVNIVVDAPELDNKPEPSVCGTWREVTAECRVDLVPFSITFFVHQPSHKFAAPRYRDLRVIAVKAAHDVELSQSVLGEVRTPSDAVQVIRSYAVAHRSRRTTLARLADKFADSLFMEAMPTGGFVLRCADALRVSWSLQNKWSHIAPFHHRMKFDLEYMDEQYLKEIKRTHSQLIDPSLETDERTALLAKIISICLEANQAPTESDTDTEGRSRRTTLDAEPELPQERKRSGDKLPDVGVKRSKKDSEVMAPPKQLPKKGKPKGKAGGVNLKNKDGEKVKESAVNGENTKKVKESDNGKENIDNGQKGKASGVSGQKDKQNAASGQKNKVSAKTAQKHNENNKENVQKVKDTNGENAKENGKKVKESAVNEQIVKVKAVSDQKGTDRAVNSQKNKEVVQKSKDNVECGHKDKQSAANVQKSKESTIAAQKDKVNNANTQKVAKKPSTQVENAKKAVKRPLENADEKNTEDNHITAKESTVSKSAKVVSKKSKTEVKTDGNTKKASKSDKAAVINDEEQIEKSKNAQKSDKVEDMNPNVNKDKKEDNEKAKKVQKPDNVADINPKEAIEKSNKLQKPVKVASVKTHNKDEKSDKVVDKKQVKESKNVSNKNKTETKNSATAKEANVEIILSGNIALPKTTPNTAKVSQNTNANDKNTQNKQKKRDTLTVKHNNRDKTENAAQNNKIPETIPVKSTKIPMKTVLDVVKPKPVITSVHKIPISKNILTQNFKKGSKIPKKKLSLISETHKRFENPLRISPRKTQTILKPGQSVGASKQLNAVRNSPRLLKKPGNQPKSMFAF